MSSWTEKNGFADWLIALIWAILAFVMFQIVGTIVGVILIFVTDPEAAQNVADLGSNMARYFDTLLIGNTFGQFFVLGFLTWLIAKLSFEKGTIASKFGLTWKPGNHLDLILILAAVIIVQPLVWFLGYLNAFIPLPDWWMTMEEQQLKMLEDYLKGDFNVVATLLFIAVTPALCEEWMMRGYLLRIFEKSWGVVAAIAISSLLFGLFHLRITQVIPLSVLGALFAYFTIKSGSLYPAIAGHFLNNAASVLLAKVYPEFVFEQMASEAMPPIWLVALSFALSILLFWIYDSKIRSNHDLSRSYTSRS